MAPRGTWFKEQRLQRGLAFGTVDSWLVWKLTGGEVHVTDATNASRTLLANLWTLDWDDELLALFGVDRSLLPRIARSSETVGEAELLGARIPIMGIAGDQQAALYGQGCHEPGRAKATYGTGSFLLVHTGAEAVPPPHGLLATAAADGYAARGSRARERRGDPVAPRRVGHPGRRGRERGAGARASSRPEASCSCPR